MTLKICAITNVYNEDFNLPIWLKYYGGQVGPENCLILDRGSDDGSTGNIGGANIIRLPRTKFDDTRRANAVSDIAGGLLRFYDYVIYSDCDEIAIPDPRKYSGITQFLETEKPEYTTAIGLNVIQKIDEEDALDGSSPILQQRRYVHPVSPMCKTMVTRIPLRWGGGFHSSSKPPIFGSLFMLHLRSVDVSAALRRLGTTRRLEWSDPNAGGHQRRPVADALKQFQAYMTWPIENDFDAAIREFVERVEPLTFVRNEKYVVPLDQNFPKLVRLPESFTDII